MSMQVFKKSIAFLIDNYQLIIINAETFTRLRLARNDNYQFYPRAEGEPASKHYQIPIINYQFRLLTLILSLLFAATSCTERSTSFEIDTIEIGVADEAKERAKRERQFIQTLYNQIYQAPLPPSDAVAFSELFQSIGDRQVAIEVIVAKMVADPNAVLPSLTDLRGDPEAFTAQLYRRLYVRDATQAELSWWVNYLETHPDVDVAQVVFAFVTANEYRYY